MAANSSLGADGVTMKRITFKSGPLKGKTYDVPVNATRHDLAGGHYEIDGYTAKWRTKLAAPTAQVSDESEHAHKPAQHRDGKEPWCKTCGLNKDYEEPVSKLATQG